MKIVLDTNVIVAAFAARGLCNDVLEICLAEHEIILSKHIITEIENNFAKKIKLPDSMIKDTISYLENKSHLVSPADIPSSICRDKDDLAAIGTAVSGQKPIL